ncbi:hypothetical protein PACTADRAFT_48860 [Pachysolen tannophilus NRRL Y-2460]|uniref:Oligomycin resistance ATP-dependent permease YOR1 n=1 Tax=Pachysolen tannophilus NRRL Y-2460 TaxID=669874 RepID=A0A1E4TZE3_PACTA|nr:hypothetical protein PACTADRAFT_48860 [Pachysolen tannophilus NRRL Y-2460]
MAEDESSSIQVFEKEKNGKSHAMIEEAQPVEYMKQRRLFSFLFSKKVPPIPTPDERKPYPFRKANIIYKIFFWWLMPLMNTGYKRTLQQEDLWYLDGDLKIEEYYAIFEKRLAKRTQKAREAHLKLLEEKKKNGTFDPNEDNEFEFEYPRYSLVWALFDTFKWEYSLSIVFVALADVGFTLNPLLSKALIDFVEDRVLGYKTNIGHGVGYAIGCSALVSVSGILINHFFNLSTQVGAKSKATLTKAMLEKSFKLNAKGRHNYPASKITSMLGTDLSRVDLGIGFQPIAIVFPIPVAISIALLIVNIGVSSLAGIGIFIISTIIIALATKKLFSYRKKITKFTDSRINYMKELLNNVRIIKYYSWEPSYKETIADVRTSEMYNIFKLQILRNFLTAYAVCLPQISSMVSFLVMYAVDKNRSAGQIFASLSLFNVLSQQIMMLPLALATGSDALVGIDRVRGLLQSGEDDPKDRESSYVDVDELIEKKLAISVRNATFQWKTFEQIDESVSPSKEEEEKEKQIEREEERLNNINKQLSGNFDQSSSLSVKHTKFPGLKHLDFDIKQGEFIIITGIIGSGKSSLLNALAGFMDKEEGELKINGSLLLCGYPWIQNAPVKENILFDSEYDEKKYKDTIYACSLDADLDILPAGDRTEIGERGITLSGGQKARINLARAVYAVNDIILLDDVLSAVDARVGKHIMDNCFMGLLKDKTRILATHQLSMINSADRVIFLNGDGTVDIGTPDELLKSNAAFLNLMEFSNDEKNTEEEQKEMNDEEDKELKRQMTEKSLLNDNDEDDEESRKDFTSKTGEAQLIQKEERAINGISFSIYKNYVMAGSGALKAGMTPVFFFFVILATFFQLFTNTWLSFWTEEKFPGRSSGFYIGLYVAFTCLTIIFVSTEFSLIVFITNKASKLLNIAAVTNLLHAPMSFFDTTPIGRILNRFTKDTDALDNEISQQLRLFIYPTANVCGVLILCIIYLPWFAIAVPFLVALFIGFANFYQASSREIKRLEALARSFVYNNFNETLGGMTTIKSFKAESRFLIKNNLYINRMNEAYFISLSNQRWLGIHLDLVASAFALIIALLSVTRQFQISAASVGLLVSYVMQIAGQLSLLIRAMTQVENEMNSVERLDYYAFHLPSEAPFDIPETAPPPTWPQHGVVEFKNVSLAYRPGLPLVLNNISFSVKAGEKIGICGRTGAGKSSIMTALYRLAELANGEINIDGINIAKIGLNSLRSKLSIIPQDPVLFRGNIRKNLDPFNKHNDDELWGALRRSGLIEESELSKVKCQALTDPQLHKFHLDQVVEDDGSNFSLGEKQLIALARAVVRNSKILILDEATSSVDYETDAKIQKTIVQEFSSCTILCIAHRLKTIVDYDRILVLDKGQVQQFNTPWVLFNKEGIFQKMCERSKITALDFNRKS